MAEGKSVCQTPPEKETSDQGIMQTRGKTNVFLKLPPELRLMIYTLLLAPQSDEIILYDDGHTMWDALYPAILCTCKLLHAEGIQVLYRKTLVIDIEYVKESFDMSDTMGAWCRQVGRSTKWISKVRLRGNSGCDISRGIIIHGIGYTLLVDSIITEIARYLKQVQVIEIEPRSWEAGMWMWSTATLFRMHHRPAARMKRTIANPDELMMPIEGDSWMQDWNAPFEKLLKECKNLKQLTVLTNLGETTGLNDDQMLLQEYLHNLLSGEGDLAGQALVSQEPWRAGEGGNWTVYRKISWANTRRRMRAREKKMQEAAKSKPSEKDGQTTS